MKSVIVYLSIIIVGAFHFSASAQMVKFIKNPYQAKYRVYITHKPKEATHLIFKVKNPTDIRKPGDWYVVTNPQLFNNAITLYVVGKKADADWVVYYVSTRDSATIKNLE